MKRTGACPKCSGRKLWVIEQFGVKDQSVIYGGGMPLRIVAKRPGEAKKSSWLGIPGDSERFYDAGKFDAWICAECGFTEVYASGMETLVHNPESGVHFVDTTPKS